MTLSLRENRLVVFLSNSGTLARWQREGILRRELLLYRELLRIGTFERISLYTGSRTDAAILSELRRDEPLFERLDLVAPPRPFDGARGAMAMIGGIAAAFVHRRMLARARWLKTNQMSSAVAAVAARLTSGTPLLLRFGYPLSRNYRERGEKARELIAALLESIATRAARAIVVTSRDVHDDLAARPHLVGRVHLVPSYVDTSLFRPKLGHRPTRPLLCIARFDREKNLAALIKAAHALGMPLDLLGSGAEEAELRALAKAGPAPIRFLPKIPNEHLAALMHEYRMFILPSYNEGLPKVLMEAMAAGLVCIASTIPGVVDLIVDGETGYLINGFDAAAIAAAIRRAETSDPQIGQVASRLITQNFGLEHHARLEATVYR